MSEASVVRLFVTSQSPDYDSPWQAERSRSGSGSGVIVGARRILTGAHVVADATFIQVQKSVDSEKRVAKVIAVCHDSDLALVEVEQRNFASKDEIAKIGQLARLRDKVSVIGFPVGGDEVSITEGVVSRVELQRYSHSQRHLLAVTVDAAINEGNSGGPVYKDGEVAGIAFQTLDDAENIGEMVPAPLIRRFLRAVREKRPVEVPSLSLRYQALENQALRKSVGLPAGDSGVLVRHAPFEGSASSTLRTGDVLLELNGHRIENNGTVQYGEGIRTAFEVLVGEHFVGDSRPARVLRGGKYKRVKIKLLPPSHLVPRSRYGIQPRYFTYGGLLLQPLSRDFLETWASWWDKAPSELLHAYYHGSKSRERRELIVLTQVLADQINVSYEDHVNETITLVNGKVPRDLEHLISLVRSSKGKVDFQSACGAHLVFNAQAARAANRRILNRYQIADDRRL